MAITREWVIAEIQRVAAEIGAAPGRRTFEERSGITPSDWGGRYWARWSDALRAAGLEPNALNTRRDDDEVVRALIEETRRLGHLPTDLEIRLRRRSDPSFPSHGTVRARGNRAAIARLVLEYTESHSGYADVGALLGSAGVAPVAAEPERDTPDAGRVAGYVYLIRSGRFYKVGFSTDVQRRMLQLNTGMPETGELVHAISTDDPAGIERYWHLRFAERRLRPDAEWFDLTADDVRAFRRRKFM